VSTGAIVHFESAGNTAMGLQKKSSAVAGPAFSILFMSKA